MSKSLQKKVGVKDIAAKAGISIGTVDRVLHNRGDVKEETRKKVMAIVEDLGYTPNILAKSLASKKTTRIAIVIPDSSDNNPYWEIPIKGIKLAADELSSYNVEIDYVFFDASSEESFTNVLQEVCKKNPDGVVLNPVFRSSALKFINVFNSKNIPYVFIDVNIKGVGNLGYFGQDAEQSGIVAARLMSSNIPAGSDVLIVKQSNKKVFSQHIDSRVHGFLKYFEPAPRSHHLNAIIVEIDLLDSGEPDKSLDEVFRKLKSVQGIFIPNSRAFRVGDYLEKNNIKGIVVIAYDLLARNADHMIRDNITFILNQKPEVQAYNAIFSLFDHLISKKGITKTNYSPIDIIIKENLEYYRI